MTELNEPDFYKSVVEGSHTNPVLVKYEAQWCSPCKVLSPTLDKVLIDYPNVVAFKVDVDSNPGLSELYSIKSIPSVLLFVNGIIVKRFVGNLDVVGIKKFLDEGLNVKA